MLAGQGGHGQLPGSLLTFHAIGQQDLYVCSQEGGHAGSHKAIALPLPSTVGSAMAMLLACCPRTSARQTLMPKCCSWVFECKWAFVGSDLSLVAELLGMRSHMPLFLNQNFFLPLEIHINVCE